MSSPGPRRLIGRARERGAIDGALAALANGRPSALVLEGEAGIGKSTLARAAADAAGVAGVVVRRGEGRAVGGGRPFGPLLDAFGCRPDADDPLRREPAVLAGATTAGSAAVAEAFADLAERDSLVSPQLLIVEDLHWVDEPSLSALAAVAARTGGLPLGILITTRPDPRTAAVALARDIAADVIAVAPLASDEVAAMVEEVLGAAPGPLLSEAVQAAGGNPFYIHAMLEALEADGHLRVRDGVADIAERVLPPTMRLTVLRSLSYLPEQTLDVLRVAAILGESIAVEHLAAALERRAVDLLADLQPALRAGVLQDEDRERIRFRHALLRESIYADLPEAVRSACHLDVARALASTGADPVVVAEHFATGAPPGDDEAIGWLLRAADELASTSLPAATSMLEHAMHLAGDIHPRRAELIAALAGPLTSVGRVREAEHLIREALRLDPPPEQEMALRIHLLSLLRHAERFEDALDEIAPTTALIDRVGLGLRGDAYHNIAAIHQGLFDNEAALRANAEALRIGEALEPEGSLVQELIQRSILLGRSDDEADRAEVLPLLDRAVQISRTRLREGRSAWLADLANALLFRGRALMEFPERAKEALLESQRIYERLGDVPLLTHVRGELAIVLFKTGDWDQVVAESEADIASQEAAGLPVTPGRYARLAHVALHRDELPTARAMVDRAKALSPRFGAFWLEALVTGATDAAAGAAMLRAIVDADGLPAVTVRELGMDGARLAAAVGDRAVADALARLEAGHAEAGGADVSHGFAAFHAGLRDDDVASLERARDALLTTGHAVAAAMTSEELAVRVAEVDPDRAKELFAAAEAVYERADARRDLASVRAAMRAAGIGVERRPARPPTGWDALTPAEADVVALAAQGLTNPQIGERLFVSRRTVQSHLSSVFRKLGIGSRVELAALASERSVDSERAQGQL